MNPALGFDARAGFARPPEPLDVAALQATVERLTARRDEAAAAREAAAKARRTAAERREAVEGRRSAVETELDKLERDASALRREVVEGADHALELRNLAVTRGGLEGDAAELDAQLVIARESEAAAQAAHVPAAQDADEAALALADAQATLAAAVSDAALDAKLGELYDLLDERRSIDSDVETARHSIEAHNRPVPGMPRPAGLPPIIATVADPPVLNLGRLPQIARRRGLWI